MKIDKKIKKAVNNNNGTKFYVDYDTENEYFAVFKLELNGKSIVDILKEGFNNTKKIISKKKDGLSVIYHSEERAEKIAKEFNGYIDDDEIKIIQCKDCGRLFYIDYKEIEWYNRNKLSLPKRDKLCRDKRKNSSKEKE